MKKKKCQNGSSPHALPLPLHTTASLMSLPQTVKTNLVHYNQWTDVEEVACGESILLCGFPPDKLDERDPPSKKEWVVPRSMADLLVTNKQIQQWFVDIALVEARPSRVTLALVNGDGTVVFYFVHDGIVKPRQN